MGNYGYGYDVYSCAQLNNEYVDKLDFNDYKNKKKKIAIQVRNTKYIEKSSLKYLNDLKVKYNLDIKISILGPYYENENDKDIIKQKYFYNTLYDLDELYKIITELEKIEDIMDEQWDKFEKVVFLAEILTRNIMYDPEYYLMYVKKMKIPSKNGPQDESDYYDRSLRGLLTRKTVCAGFAVIFKELANRNGIECKYVSGNGHAWNLVRINGVIYPLDITWKNTKYRKGDFANIDDISCDIEKFKEKHKPSDEKNNEGLTKIDEEIVKKAKEKMLFRKHFNATTFKFTRSDGTKFILSQVGRYKGMYRYLYSEIDVDGSYKIPQIVFSDSNLIKEYEDFKFERSQHYYEFREAFADVLFSKSNLEDSIINKNTKYIGACESSTPGKFVKKNSEIIKNDRAIKTFNMENIKSKRRADGSILTLVQFPNKDNNLTYVYYVYVLIRGPKVTEYRIYSNADYFSFKAEHVVNSILSDDNLNKAAKANGIIR